MQIGLPAAICTGLPITSAKTVNNLVVEDAQCRRGGDQALISALNTLSGRVFISVGARDIVGVSFLQRTGWAPAGQILGLLPSDEAELLLHQDMWLATAAVVDRTDVPRR